MLAAYGGRMVKVKIDSPDGSGKMSKYYLVIPYFLVRGHPSKGGWFPLNVLLHFSNREACNWLVTEL